MHFMARRGEKEKEGIDKGSAAGREAMGGAIRRRESRYVSLDMFLSGVKLSWGFMCLFISPLARVYTMNGYISTKKYI